MEEGRPGGEWMKGCEGMAICSNMRDTKSVHCFVGDDCYSE